MQKQQRQNMVQQQIIERGITDTDVIQAMKTVPRHCFLADDHQQNAYEDRPLVIGKGQTISQPYIVALMTQALRIKRGMKVLEIGTGCGYQTAVLSEMGARVFTIERIESLFLQVPDRLTALGYNTIQCRWGDGYQGWEEQAPFDGVIITCASTVFPDLIWQQIREGGRLVLPLEEKGVQCLYSYQKIKSRRVCETLAMVRFVPMLQGLKK